MGDPVKAAPPTQVEQSNPEQVERRNMLHHPPSPVGGEVSGAVDHPDFRGGADAAMIEATPRTIRAVWECLTARPCQPLHAKAIAALVGRLVAQGWATGHQVGEALAAFGVPRTLCEVLEALHPWLPMRSGCFRPAARETSASLHDFAAVADLAALLIRLETLGLAIDPGPLAESLRPTLLRRTVLTRSELRVLWHRRERHPVEPVDLVAPGYRPFFLERPARLPTGFRAIPDHQDGVLVALRMVQPGQRCHRPAAELPPITKANSGQPSGRVGACNLSTHGGPHA